MALTRECHEELDIRVVASCGLALAEPRPGMSLTVRLISGWRGEPRNAAPEEHTRIDFFTADEIRSLHLADPRYVPLLTSLLQPPPRIEIRRSSRADVPSVAALHALSRQETYSALSASPPRVRFRGAELTRDWRSRLATDRWAIHGGWSDRVLLGFVATTMISPLRGELSSLHVRPDWHGRGLADQLHRAALAHLVGQGGRECGLWVVEGNVRARRFYEKHGWRVAGGRRTVSRGEVTFPAIRYQRRL